MTRPPVASRKASLAGGRRRFLGDAAALGAGAAVGPWLAGSTALAAFDSSMQAAHVSDGWARTLNPVAPGTVDVRSIDDDPGAIDVYFGTPYDSRGVTHYAIFANGAFAKYVAQGYARVRGLPRRSDVTIAVRSVNIDEERRADDEIGRGTTLGGGDSDALSLNLRGVTFDTSDPARIVARVSFALLDGSGEEVPSMASTRWGVKGGSRPYDHTSTTTYPAHAQRLPAKSRSTSQPGVTEGTYLAAGQEYEYVVEASDARGNAVTSAVSSFRTPSGARSWTATEVRDLPPGNWEFVDGDDTGYVVPGRNLRDRSEERVFDTSPPGSDKAAYEHRTNHFDPRGERTVVHPMGVDSKTFTMDFSTIRRVLFRYHHWIDDFSGIPGKIMFLGLGRGWIGQGYARNDLGVYGTAGAGINVMHSTSGRHPDGRPENGFRMLGSFEDQNTPEGENIDPRSAPPPKGKWLTTDVIVTKDEGYQLLIDGVWRDGVLKDGFELSSKGSRNPVRDDWNDCKAIWYRHRNMHGGTPTNENRKAIRDSTEWFGGFFLFVEKR